MAKQRNNNLSIASTAGAISDPNLARREQAAINRKRQAQRRAGALTRFLKNRPDDFAPALRQELANLQQDADRFGRVASDAAQLQRAPFLQQHAALSQQSAETSRTRAEATELRSRHAGLADVRRSEAGVNEARVRRADAMLAPEVAQREEANRALAIQNDITQNLLPSKLRRGQAEADLAQARAGAAAGLRDTDAGQVALVTGRYPGAAAPDLRGQAAILQARAALQKLGIDAKRLEMDIQSGNFTNAGMVLSRLTQTPPDERTPEVNELIRVLSSQLQGAVGAPAVPQNRTAPKSSLPAKAAASVPIVGDTIPLF